MNTSHIMTASYLQTDDQTLAAPGYSLRDIYPEIASVIAHGQQKRFIRKWNGDLNTELAVNSLPFIVENFDQMQSIAAQSASLRREIAFGGVIDERERRVLSFLKGETGTQIECDWNKDHLIDRLHEAVAGTDHKYFLGHTHPQGYGAICSREYWDHKSLGKYSDPVSQTMLKEKRYQYFGTDFLEMRVRQWLDPKLSSFFWIVSPHHRQAGLFSIAPGDSAHIADDAKTVYYPWRKSGQ